jgi:DNA processing protein
MNTREKIIEELDIGAVLGALNDVQQKHAPASLFVMGDTALLQRGPRVAIVGSRAASLEGLARARSLARELVRHDVTVVSGLAAGVDTAAHTAALDHGGRTIAVLGTPLDQVYPKENAGLQARIAERDLLVSQFPSGMKVTPRNFPIRNRTMALLSDATVIVEAGERSGILHQGWEALRLGRLLFLMESVANDPQLTWPKEMLAYGAQILSRDNLPRVIRHLPAMRSVSDVALET